MMPANIGSCRAGIGLIVIMAVWVGASRAQVEYLVDARTGEVSSNAAVRYESSVGQGALARPQPPARMYGSEELADADRSSVGPPITIYSIQSPQGGVANVASEAPAYHAPDTDPITYSVFLNFNAQTGAAFPGAMIADNMGLGGGFQLGDEITSYDLLLYRSPLDPHPGPADVHVELWDGDPFCWIDTPGGGYACAPIAGTEADFTDIPTGTQFTARAILPKGVRPPNERVWMVLSGSETSNPSPCRLGWDMAFSVPVVGNALPDHIYLVQRDDTGEGSCCGTDSSCNVSESNTCLDDDTGSRGFCSDGDAESPRILSDPLNLITCWMNPATCTNLTATIRTHALSTISLVPVGADVPHTITGSDISISSGPAQIELEVRFSNWDPNEEGTLLKAWEADIASAGYRSGFQGFLTPTAVPCSSDDDCKAAFGGVCSFFQDACGSDAECPFYPVEKCTGSRCEFPPGVGGFCKPGFIFTGRSDYVYHTPGADLTEGDLPAVDVSTLDYRYASAVARGDGVAPPVPFHPGGAYAGTLRLDASADCAGTFEIGFFPLPGSVLVDQNNEFLPLVGFVPAKITCEIGRCCYDLGGAGGCWENVTVAQCDTAPGPAFWDPSPNASCDDLCVQCLDDATCQDGVWCNGAEVCDAVGLCHSGISPCDDTVFCTMDACDEDTQACTHEPNDGLCDDDQWCSGIEWCHPVFDCRAGTPPCSPAQCDEESDTCAVPTIPTVSSWGLVGLTLLLLVALKIKFGRLLITPIPYRDR